MKKLLIGIALCAMTTNAMAAISSFSFSPSPAGFLAGETKTLALTVDGTGAASNIVAFLGATGPFSIVGLELSAGTVWEFNQSAPPVVDLYSGLAYGSVGSSPAVGNAQLAPGSVLALVTVRADDSAALGAIGTISSETGDGPSELGGNAGIAQGVGRLEIIPEPVSALLLLAGLPLLRRRQVA